MFDLCALRTPTHPPIRRRARVVLAPWVALAVIVSGWLTMAPAAAVSAPSVSKISVTSGPLKGGTAVVISGKNFSKITSVKFGSTSAKFKVTSSTKITATAPARSAGTVDVRVSAKVGTSKIISADRFSYIAPPTVTSLSPASGTELGGTAVTITGTDFRNVTAVTFGGTKASYTVSSTTKLVTTAPKRAAGTAAVQVITGYGASSASSKAVYSYLSVPTVSTSTLPTAYAGVQYAAQLAGAKGKTPYRWSTGALPSGLSLNSSTGLISGVILSAISTNYSVAATVTDANNLKTTRTLNLTVQPSTPVIANSSELPPSSVGTAYHASLLTKDGRSGDWTIVSDDSGALKIGDDGASLAGTIDTPGTYTIKVQFTDQAKQISDPATLSLVVSTDPGGVQDLSYCNYPIRFTDDTATDVRLPFDIDFGGTQNVMYISPNGYVTFGSGTSQAGGFALEDFAQPVIAPYLADSDSSVRDQGAVRFGVSQGRQVCVTWTDMGYWNRGFDKRNTFQLILTARPDRGTGAFDITFNYSQIQWDAGDNDGGVAGLAPEGNLTSARAGYSTGLGSTDEQTVELDGSGEPGQLIDGGPHSLSAGSSNGIPGRFSYSLG